MSGWQAVRIDDLDAIVWPGAETTWRPLRAAIGARIVGMGAYTAERAGQDVVEPHREADADVHRHAVAAEDGTVVVALGGPPVFVPSSSEWIERARPHIRSDPERARAIVDELRAERPDSPSLPIAEALLAIGRGDRSAAIAALGEVSPEHRETLRADPDLGPLSGGA